MRKLWLPGVALLAGLATWGIMVVAPDRAYVRWQGPRTEAYARVGWIYERIHYDPTPIDVAFLGTSHTLNGIDGARVAAILARRGLRDADGRCTTVTNLSVPEYGRNLHWLIGRELLSTRRVKVLVVEVLENETRKAHPLFSQIASAGDILGAPLLINQNYFHDLVRLPFRQASLGVESLAPNQFGLKSRYNVPRYDGSDVDNTRYVNVGGVQVTPLRDTVMPEVELRRQASELERAKNLHMLPTSLSAWEYKVPRYYLGSLMKMADDHGAQIVFLYLPGFGKPDKPYDMTLYNGRGPMVEVNAVLRDPSNWFDVHHLNARGASRASAEAADLLAKLFLTDRTRFATFPSSGPDDCRNGQPPSSAPA